MKLSGLFSKIIPGSKLKIFALPEIFIGFMEVSGYNEPFHFTYGMKNLKVYFP